MKPLALCVLLAATGALLAIGACSGEANNNVPAGSCNPACGSGTTCLDGVCVAVDGGGGGNLDGGDISLAGKDAGPGVHVPDGGPEHCAADPYTGEQLPLDMYVMMDQSGSMKDTVASGATKWSAVTGALKSFLSQPNLTGMSVGIQYFALPDNDGTCTAMGCTKDADCGGCGPCVQINSYGDIACEATYFQESCAAADYATADVEIAALPDVANPISASITKHSPTGKNWGTNTPTSAALQGAIDHAKSWAGSHPQHVVIDVLATDGEPTECNTKMPSINAIAAAGLGGTPKVLTFVIGVKDAKNPNLDNLNGIAAAGGTTAAFIVDSSSDVNAQLIAALNQIRGAALGCSYKIPVPKSGTPDYTKVNVQYTPGGGSAAMFPQVASKAACVANQDGWYYDNAAAPTQIILCDSTCTKIKADNKGKIDVLLGCSTIIN